MGKINASTSCFITGMQRLGFQNDDALFFTNHANRIHNPEISFHIETAQLFGATALYLRRQLSGSRKPQVYLFDYTDRGFSEQIENEIANIQKRIWSSGEVPLACIFFNTEIKIIDCTKHLTKNFKPEYLIESLKLVGKAHDLYNEQFAIKIKSGIFWEQDELKGKFVFKNSAYDTLISNIRKVTDKLSKELKNTSRELINKIIVQSILIKYLEETSDTGGKKLLTEKYLKKYSNSNSFSDVLKKGKFVNLLTDLNKNFNGNVFKWEIEEQKQLDALDLGIVADLLATDKTSIDSPQLEFGFPDWRYFEFKFIPVELISRLYEEFLGKNKKDKGLFYTPSHLAKLLVDECLPLKKFEDINLNTFSILDPACGSGIFLVTAFKRLVQIWRLQHNLTKRPNIEDLKRIQRNIYGVDKEEQAVMLTSFSLSLALCNELDPIEVIENLRFDDLCENNLVHSDFFKSNKIKDRKFDLIIGNPPFVRGAISEYSNTWLLNDKNVKIPQGQIALKFLSESFQYLKENGLICLIIKSSGLLYNSTSNTYKKALFSNYNVVQILDFTALARNKSLWDNGADVATATIFVRNNKPDVNRNILHLTFRRTKATKERIVFEIDDYDLHFVNRQTAINNEFIWKNNLLGGGRIKNLVEKVQSLPLLQKILNDNDCISGEGFIKGNNGHLNPDYIFKYQTLPTEAISDKGIEYNRLMSIDKKTMFVKVLEELLLKTPNIIIWENIGTNKLPVFLNKTSFSFKDKIFSIATKENDKTLLKNIVDSFNTYSDFYRFYMYVTSSQILINLNTAALKKDYMNLRFVIGESISVKHFSDFDKKVISDVNTFFQDFIRHGEKSKAVQQIRQNQIKSVLSNYGIEFSRALNSVYESRGRRFRLSDVVEIENSSLIATIFRYDFENEEPLFHKDVSKLNIEGLTNNEISAQLSVKRIIKLYPQKDTIVFVKPNQYRFWLSLTAYRDADKCFSDLSKQIDE
jgi:methylase of polypeptide subunit release factors